MPTIYHSFERHLISDPNEIHRRKKVNESWAWLYEREGVIPVPYEEYKRTARDIGDKRDLPYLKDCLEIAMQAAKEPDDIIMFTNDDIILHRETARILKRHIAIWDACSSHRCEFHYRRMPSMEAPPSVFAEGRESHIGRDMFAFKKEWLQRFWHEIPDFILGASDWDLMMAWWLREKKGFKATQENLWKVFAPCELLLGCVIHEFHKAGWTDSANVMSAPSQLHNRKLFVEWVKKRGIKLTWDWCSEVEAMV